MIPERAGLRPADELVRPAVEAAVALARQEIDDEAAEPPPRGLRPFLRFTRLPDRAVAAARKVLDEDEAFRDRVRRTTSEELLGRAPWLYLERPEGWEGELASLAAAASDDAEAVSQRQTESQGAKRLAATEAARAKAEEMTARLNAELAESKELLASERRARRLVETEAGRIRRRLGDLEAERRELQSAVDRLEARLAALVDESAENPGARTQPPPAAVPPPPPLESRLDADAVAAAHAAALGAAEVVAGALADLRSRLGPLFEVVTAEAARRGDAIGSGNVAPSPRPSRRPTPLPPAILDDSIEAAEHLVRVEAVVLVVDGYNVTKLARPDLDLAEQRRWLVDAAVETATRTGARFEVVFDGADDRASAPAHLSPRTGVQVRFSPADVEADDVVLARAAAMASPVVVASDDRRVRDGARRLGVNVVSVAQLLAAMKRPWIP